MFCCRQRRLRYVYICADGLGREKEPTVPVPRTEPHTSGKLHVYGKCNDTHIYTYVTIYVYIYHLCVLRPLFPRELTLQGNNAGGASNPSSLAPRMRAGGIDRMLDQSTCSLE